MATDTTEWRKSSRSNGDGGDCVEVSRHGIRDSKNPADALTTEWATVRHAVDAIKTGRFDR
ncbi:hypothetical protein JOF56_011600 [Kibdelosporangium banguiense]|uniref:DUF397 domain-containing protein n=1 Tax=Kibdelosporangium banguiense TaxID=1365924 RepID=A0ABS4U3I7_9PSEU|nr:DUF397 domain-containing protein [Kibdelosporangium banguiense]MBP2331215.1 hypothetical protein [Kibdelosporangium banguiense]